MGRLERLAGLVTLAAALAGGAVAASAQSGDAEQGATIARRWCAACHVVAQGQDRASADVPSFMAVAAKIASPDALKAFLADPHPKMPDMSLTRAEIADLTAYIVSLRPGP